MNHRPVCVKCQVEMKPEMNGVGLLDMASFGEYQVWDADLWACPTCDYQIVTGFGRQPIVSHYEPSFHRVKESYKEHRKLIVSWESPKVKVK